MGQKEVGSALAGRGNGAPCRDKAPPFCQIDDPLINAKPSYVIRLGWPSV
jgi:hypothetical protein